VVVKLNTGVDYRGVLACLDGYMNIAMEQVRCSRVRACVAV
jgi:U6 snRNA-associated Sm-like protein LSm6